MSAVLIGLVWLLPLVLWAQNAAKADQVGAEFARMGKRGKAVAEARERALEILDSENGCSQWFRETDAQAAEVLRSLHYVVDEHGPLYVRIMRVWRSEPLNKDPWGASTSQGGGRDSWIVLNGTGPFFTEVSPVIYVDTAGSFVGVGGRQALFVGGYVGKSPEAQVTILLHELGHIVGRLPEDDDSWDGRSSENTLEVMRHCKAEIRGAARRELSAGRTALR